MELKDLVQTALVQIAEGMMEAQKQIGDTVSVNPPYEEKYGIRAMSYANKVRPVEKVEFDVWCRAANAKTLEVSGNVKTSLGLFVINADADAGLEKNEEREGITHIRFETYVSWPAGKGLR